jgi:hypothetical protein
VGPAAASSARRFRATLPSAVGCPRAQRQREFGAARFDAVAPQVVGRDPRSVRGLVLLDELGEDGCCLGLHAGEDVLADAHRERDVRVGEALADDLHGHARLEQERGVGVAEVVQ